MNENSSKKILFNKSTLLSLKAELLKKQEEVSEKKRLPQNKVEYFKPPASQKNEKCSDKSEKRSFKDRLKAVDTEELEALRKSKSALEKKSELYEHLLDAAGTSHLNSQFLVDFSSKKQQEPIRPKSPELKQAEPIINEDYGDDSEWTEYVDCLGRSRKCLKTDIELYRKRDQELLRAIKKDTGTDQDELKTIKDNPTVQIEESDPEKAEVAKQTNDYLQSLRDRWEKKEQELLAKEGDIHYQDVLFDEARIHGVGYFSFSTDETERRKQMDELMKTRQETLEAQKEAEVIRKKRDELVAARVAAARARRRLRAGLPPEEPAEKKKNFEECLLEFLNQQRNEAEAKANEKEKQLKEEQEKEKEKQRQAYIREWDLGKEGVGGEKKEKFRQISQEEYVEQQRDKRVKEFAPPKIDNRKSKSGFNVKGEFVKPEASQVLKTWSEVRPLVNNNQTIIDEDQTKGLYFSSKTKYDNFVQGPSMIVNEMETENDVAEKEFRKRKCTEHAEIPPPPTFEIYGPSTTKHKFKPIFTSDMKEAYAQGVKQLEKKKSKLNISEQYDFIL